MKSKIRITRTDWQGSYRHLHFQFLHNRFEDSKYLEPYFFVSWQTDIHNDRWYACYFELNSDQLKKAEYMLKVMRFITKEFGSRLFSVQPAEFLHYLKPEIYGYAQSEFLPVTLNGCNSYKLMKNGSHWSTVYAFNVDQAYNLAQKEPNFYGDNCEVILWNEKLTITPDPIDRN